VPANNGASLAIFASVAITSCKELTHTAETAAAVCLAGYQQLCGWLEWSFEELKYSSAPSKISDPAPMYAPANSSAARSQVVQFRVALAQPQVQKWIAHGVGAVPGHCQVVAAGEVVLTEDVTSPRGPESRWPPPVRLWFGKQVPGGPVLFQCCCILALPLASASPLLRSAWMRLWVSSTSSNIVVRNANLPTVERLRPMINLHLFEDDWQGVTSQDSEYQCESPQQIHEALSKLNGTNKTIVALIVDDDRHLTVGGGNDGRYVCYVTSGSHILNLKNPAVDKEIKTVRIVTGGQGRVSTRSLR
jgi:hypothetical protein